MKRRERILLSLVLASAMAGLYWTGPDPEVCGFDCVRNQNLGVGLAIFAVTLLVALRLFKKLSDLIRRSGE